MCFVKKILSVFLCIVMVILTCSAAVSGIEKEVELTEYPVIMVPGYSSSTLLKINEDGSEEQVWGLDFDKVIQLVLKKIAQIGIGIGALTVGNSDYLADLVGKEFVNLVKDMKCNPDGSSTENIQLKFPTAECSNSQVMWDIYGDDSWQYEVEIMGMVADYIGRENMYNFSCDWRMGAIECAERLDEYIQEIKERDNVDKVNILAVSHGGQVTATYLSLFGYKEDVHNAVMTVPAASGAVVMYDLLTQTIEFNELNLLYFIENGMMWENDYHWLVEAQQLGFLDEVLNKLVPYLFQIMGNWGSVWDFCPTDIYEEMKAKWLDPVANAELIRKSDIMHYEIMPKYGEAFTKCIEDYDINVSIIAGTDIDSTTGKKVNSDGIIFTAGATGATCPTHGERFADGYVQVNPCGGKYKVSPAMTVDASTAFLPDNTWFVSGLFHGMTFKDNYTTELMMLLTLTDEIKDVYTNPDYPQFHESSNASHGIWAKFNNSTEGYVSSEDTTLIVKNTSNLGYKLRVLGISCDGADIYFDLKNVKTIKAGETAEIPFSGDLPAVSGKRISLIFSYFATGSLTPVGQRVMSFTVMNGDSAEYSADAPMSNAYAETPFDKSPFTAFSSLLTKNGLYNFVAMFYNIFWNWFNSLVRAF